MSATDTQTHPLAVVTTTTEPTEPYTVTTIAEKITAVCACGARSAHPNKGLGRANLGAWKTRHQSCKAPA